MPFKLEDQTGRLTAAERQSLEKVLADDALKTGVELNVLVVAGVPGGDFRNHATQARRRCSVQWDNSILVVVNLGDRHVEIATAPRYNTLFTPAVTNQLLVKSAVPFLREGQLANGIAAALDAVTEVLLKKSPMPSSGGVPARFPKSVLMIFVAVGVVACGIVGFQYYRNHTCRGCRGWGNHATRVVRSATPSVPGLTEHSFQCNRCRTNYSWQTTISYSDHNSTHTSSGASSGGADGGGGAGF